MQDNIISELKCLLRTATSLENLLHLQPWPGLPKHHFYRLLEEMSKVDIWVCVCACVRMIDRDTVSYVSLSFLLQTLHERAKIQRFMRRLTPRRAHHQCSALTRLTHKTRTYILRLLLCPHLCLNHHMSTYTDASWRLHTDRQHCIGRLKIVQVRTVNRLSHWA